MRYLSTITLAILATSGLYAAELAVGALNPASGAPGATLTAPIAFRATGSQLVALSFDLIYDKSKFTIAVDAGPAATAAKKGVTVGDLPGGIRVLVLGTNILDLTPITDGDIATLSIRIASGAAAGTSSLQMTNATGSNSNGTSATLSPTGASLTVTSSSGGGGGTGGGTAKNQVLAHLAAGDVWSTQFTFVNLDDRNPTQITLSFFKQDGTALALPIVGETGRSSSVVRAIGAGGSVTITTAADPTLNVGWANLVTTGSVDGQAVFSSQGQFATVGLTSSASRLLLPFDNVGGAATAMALINTNKASPAQVQVTIRDDRGVTLLTDVILLTSSGHSAFDIPGKWSATAGRRGIIDLKLATPDISGLGFRFNGSSFTSIPMIPVP